MSLLPTLLLLALPAFRADDDTFAVTLAFEGMHCDECKAELETILKKLQGFKSVQITDATAAVTFDEKAPVPVFSRLPKDLRLKSAILSLRGTVTFSGDNAVLVAKGSGASLALVGSKREDKLAQLRKQMGKNGRFLITGAVKGGKTIVVESFTPAEW